MDKNQYNSKFFKVYEDFLNCKEMRELIHTSQIGMAGWFFLSVLTMHTARTDGILYKFDDDERLVPLTNKDISNWFIGMTDFDEETVGMYINLLILKKLLYTNKFGCLTITNYCYTDGNEPSLHSINDPSAKLKIFGVWENDRRIERWKTKYKAILEKSGQSNLLEIEMDYSDYINLSDLTELLNLPKSTFSRYSKIFLGRYPDAIVSTNKKSKAFKKNYIDAFKQMFNLKEKQVKNEVEQNGTIVEQSMEQKVEQFPNNFDSSENPHKYAEIEDGTKSGTISRKVEQCGTIVEQSTYIDNKDNKDNKDINNKYIYSSNPAEENVSIISERNDEYIFKQKEKWFGEFWDLYPRKVEKKKCQELFPKVITSEERFQEMMDGMKKTVIAKYENECDVTYIPHPLKFLKEERWTDAPYTPPKNKKTEKGTSKSYSNEPIMIDVPYYLLMQRDMQNLGIEFNEGNKKKYAEEVLKKGKWNNGSAITKEQKTELEELAKKPLTSFAEELDLKLKILKMKAGFENQKLLVPKELKVKFEEIEKIDDRPPTEKEKAWLIEALKKIKTEDTDEEKERKLEEAERKREEEQYVTPDHIAKTRLI